MFWLKWVGLPWAWGADPREGRAACCFRTAQAAREELGLPWPSEYMDDWYRAASAGYWMGLRNDWDRLTARTREPEAGVLLRFDNKDGSFGLGVLVEPEVVVTVPHQGRLLVAPRKPLGPVTLYQIR